MKKHIVEMIIKNKFCHAVKAPFDEMMKISILLRDEWDDHEMELA